MEKINDRSAGTLHRSAFSLVRSEPLAEGIFAIVLTPLALELKLLESGGDADFLTVLYQNSGTLEGYCICFFIVGNLWRLHHLVTDQPFDSNLRPLRTCCSWPA